MTGTRGANKLARTIANKIVDVSTKPDSMELGTIQEDNSLLCDRFPIKIPTGDYLKAEGLTLTPGDRVLVAWVNLGKDPVVICRVEAS